MEAPPYPLSSRPKRRDLQFRGPLLEMFFDSAEGSATSCPSSKSNPQHPFLHFAKIADCNRSRSPAGNS